MSNDNPAGPRCAVLVGPYTSGKTTLLESLLHHAGAIARRGSVKDGNAVGDSSTEARTREMSVEPNVAHCDYLGERWHFIDCPGSLELAQDARNALMAADVAVIVAEPEPDKAIGLAPLFKFLDDYQIPHMLFVNKMDKAQVRARDLLHALQAVSSRPLVLRQVPIREGESITGFVDLVSERAYHYQEGKASDLIEMPETVRGREGEARQELLEALADFDDALLEQLLEDKTPPADEVYQQLSKDLTDDLIVPVFLGSAEHENGIQRLFKALRHETPDVSVTAERLGVPAGNSTGEFAATVVKTLYQGHSGKLSIARLWSGSLKDGQSLGASRIGGLSYIQGGELEAAPQAEAGDLVGLGRLEEAKTGALLTANGVMENPGLWPEPLTPLYGLALEPERREDEVKLTGAVAKLIEEDPSLALEQVPETHELVLLGQGEIHLRLAVERLKNRFKVGVTARRPSTPYKETITKGAKHHARHKRQSGGHGQFGDVHVEIKPLPRGEGFAFEDAIVGGAIPRNYIPAVENGVKEYLARGPLGFPVVDVAVKLYDGQHHAVDSSEQAFKTAGRLAMQEALPGCNPVLLEPIHEVTISVPSDYTSRINSIISSHRGQILGFDAKPGWDGWDELKAYMPQAELADLIVEIRSQTQGVGSYVSTFHHLQELTGKLADQVIQQSQAAE